MEKPDRIRESSLMKAADGQIFSGSLPYRIIALPTCLRFGRCFGSQVALIYSWKRL